LGLSLVDFHENSSSESARNLSFITNNMIMKSSSVLAVIFLFGLCNCSLLRSRKKRQIMDAINALTEEALEAEKMEELLKEEKVQSKKEEVQSVDGANMLRCEATVNSQCGGKECIVSCSDGKGEKVALSCESGFVDVKGSSGDAAIVEVKCGTAAAVEGNQGKALGMEEVVSRKRRQDTNPFFGRGQRNLKSEGFENVQRARTTGLFGNVQQCQGGRCDQLNLLSRRKRQIMEAMETLTEEVDKFEKEVEQLEKDLLKDDQKVHMLSCDSNVNSQCKGKECVVSCGDGKGSKVTLQCEDGLVDVNSVNSRDITDVQVKCGSAKEAAGKAKAFRDLLESQSSIFQM